MSLQTRPSQKGVSPHAVKLFVFGLIIGIASITPGLSGGIIAIALGVYAPALSAVRSLRRAFKESAQFLLPLGVGVLLGLFLFGLLMKPLLLHYQESVICLFAGLIIGSLPSVFKEANEKGFRLVFLLPLLIAFFIGILSARTAFSALSLAPSPLLYALGGGVFALGMIVPGISSSFILIEMGIYTDILSAFISMDFAVLLPVILGAVLFLPLFFHLIQLAFSRWHGLSYYAAIGFLLSSLFAVFSGFHTFGDALLFLLGAAAVYLFMRRADTISENI